LAKKINASETGRRRAELGLWGYILFYNTVGDLILKDTNGKIKLAQELGTAVRDNASTSEKKKGAEQLEHKNNIYTYPIIAGPGAGLSPSTAGHKLARFILTGKGLTGGNYLVAPQFLAVVAAEEKLAKHSIRIVTRDPSEAFSKIGLGGFKGIKGSSACAVRKAINDKNVLGCDAQKTTGFPVLIENIDWFVKVIKNSPLSKKEELTEALIKYNEYMAATGIINAMYSVLEDAQGSARYLQENTGDLNAQTNSPSKPSQAVLTAADKQMALMRKASKTLEVAKKSIAKDTGNLKEYGQIKYIFQKQEEENRKRGMKQAIQ